MSLAISDSSSKQRVQQDGKVLFLGCHFPIHFFSAELPLLMLLLLLLHSLLCIVYHRIITVVVVDDIHARQQCVREKESD